MGDADKPTSPSGSDGDTDILASGNEVCLENFGSGRRGCEPHYVVV